MEKFSYNSYPDSNDSSPRSREIDFENPPPWDDQQNQLPQNYKVKFMCSYGGKILPRSHDNHLTYVNGETKILSVDRSIRFPVLASKLAAVCGGDGGGDVSFKYQLPGEDLDALISVTNDDDLEHMMHEYDRLVRTSSKPARLRLFLFPVSSASGGFGSEGSAQSDRDRFVEALNTVPNRTESEKSVTTPPNNTDFMFVSEKIAAPPLSLPEVKLPSPAAVPLETPLFNDQRVIQPDHGANPVETHRIMHDFQRMQIRDQDQHHQQQLKQQQETVYIRKNEDGFMETGAYFPPSYTQNPPSPQPPPQPPIVPQTNQQPPPPYWKGNHNPGGGIFPKTTPVLPEQPPLYMIPSPSPSPHPGGLYHAPPPQAVMRPIATGQSNQGYYPPPVQRLAPPDTYREQQYTLSHTQPPPAVTQAQPLPPFTSAPLPPQYSAVPPPRQVITTGPIGLPDTSAYNYTGGIGKQLYYTETGPGGMIVPPPQYHGIGLPVTGPDGKVIAINRTPKVSSQSSDSAV